MSAAAAADVAAAAPAVDAAVDACVDAVEESVESSSIQVANKSPMHLQLLMMMGSCHNSEAIMEEAMKVQRLLLAIEPEEAAAAPTAAPLATAQTGKKKKKGGAKSTGAATHADADVPAYAMPSDDPSLPWSTPAIAALTASSDPLALLQLALLHDPANPWHTHLRDAAQSIKYYGLAAIKVPSTYACARLAHFYITGEHTGGKDMAKGAKWLRMGASKGHALCQHQLAFMLEDGMGQPCDVKQACTWYQKAADLKYPPAMYSLATLLLEPDETYPGVEQDIYTAIRLMEDAAQMGESSAQLKLGHLCFLGNNDLDVEASMSRAVHYFTLAAHNQNEPSIDAAKILGIIYGTAETETYENEWYDLEKAVRYLRIAADSGHADSRTLLQQHMAKLKQVQSGMVIDRSSNHLKAVKLLNSIEAPSTANESASEAAAALAHTPSKESLYLALARLHARYPDYGATRLHAALKAEYIQWAVSEKRVKLVMREEGWTAAESAGATAAAAAAAEAAPIPETLLSDEENTAKRLIDRVIVNDLD